MEIELTIEERKKIQLEMLKEIDDFCIRNNIKYSLAFGTLLGAIRHKGFIPWDDDVDIMMPLPDMLKFKKTFNSNYMKYCDVDTEKHYEFDFSRIANTKTYNKCGIAYKSYGLSIDLYPIINIPSCKEEQDSFFLKAEEHQNKRLFLRKWRGRIIRRLPLSTIYGFDSSVRKQRDYMLKTIPYGSTNTYYVVAGPISIRSKMIYDFDPFNSMIKVCFEGYEFSAIENYDKFLSLRYGNYMQLPPISERVPYHGGSFFWKS